MFSNEVIVTRYVTYVNLTVLSNGKVAKLSTFTCNEVLRFSAILVLLFRYFRDEATALQVIHKRTAGHNRFTTAKFRANFVVRNIRFTNTEPRFHIQRASFSRISRSMAQGHGTNTQ